MDSTHVSVALVIVCGCDAAKIDLPRENSSFLVLNFDSFSGDFLACAEKRCVVFENRKTCWVCRYDIHVIEQDLLDKYKERYFKQWQKNSSQTYNEKICCVYTSTEKNNLVAVHSLGILRW